MTETQAPEQRGLPPEADVAFITTERPLVTFALFAYNQERYIREAINGAFSQTYEPLEIILSDDCSTDRTFEIMQEMAAEYKGPHRIGLNKNPKNIGTLHHLLKVAARMSGEYLVVAAGDDISKPERAKILVETLISSNSWAVCSGYDVINSRNELKQVAVLAPKKTGLQRYFRNPRPKNIRVIQGSTAGYAKKCFDYDLSGSPRILTEDNILNFLIYASGGKVEQSQRSLVFYRKHDGAVHNKETGFADTRSRELARIEEAAERINKNVVYLKIARQFDCANRKIQSRMIEDEIRFAQAIKKWSHLSWWRRVIFLLKELASHGGQNAKWMTARLFGTFPNYQPLLSLKPTTKR